MHWDGSLKLNKKEQEGCGVQHRAFFSLLVCPLLVALQCVCEESRCLCESRSELSAGDRRSGEGNRERQRSIGAHADAQSAAIAAHMLDDGGEHVNGQ